MYLRGIIRKKQYEEFSEDFKKMLNLEEPPDEKSNIWKLNLFQKIYWATYPIYHIQTVGCHLENYVECYQELFHYQHIFSQLIEKFGDVSDVNRELVSDASFMNFMNFLHQVMQSMLLGVRIYTEMEASVFLSEESADTGEESSF